MLSCINKNSREFQRLKQVSGLPESVLESFSREFITKHNRFPYLDELPQANSEPYVRKELLKMSGNSIDTKKLLDITSTHTLRDALIKLNNEYRDLEISGLELGETSILNITHKPIKYLNQKSDFRNDYDYEETNSTIVYNNVVDRLSNLYGINVIPITNNDILTNEAFSGIQDATSAKGFIYNNTIYINTDNASIDTPIHELLHLVFGTMKFTNPEVYMKTVAQAEQFDSYPQISKLYPNRTRLDLAEEVYITEMAKYLSHSNSNIKELDYEVAYHMDRLLDAALAGKYSVSCIDNAYDKPLNYLANILDSPLVNVKTTSSLNLSRIHRILANAKSKLIKSKDLKEDCV